MQPEGFPKNRPQKLQRHIGHRTLKIWG